PFGPCGTGRALRRLVGGLVGGLVCRLFLGGSGFFHRRIGSLRIGFGVLAVLSLVVLGLVRLLAVLGRLLGPIRQIALSILVLEIGFVPASALEPEDGRRHQPIELRLAAFRAFPQ